MYANTYLGYYPIDIMVNVYMLFLGHWRLICIGNNTNRSTFNSKIAEHQQIKMCAWKLVSYWYISVLRVHPQQEQNNQIMKQQRYVRTNINTVQTSISVYAEVVSISAVRGLISQVDHQK